MYHPTISIEQQIDQQSKQRRDEISLAITRYLFFVTIVFLFALVGLAFVYDEYHQFPVFIFSYLPAALVIWFYPKLIAKNQANFANVAFILTMLILCFSVSIIMPFLISSVALGYVLVILMSGLLLERKVSYGVLSLSIFLLVIGISFGNSISSNIFLPFNETLQNVISASMSISTMLIVGLLSLFFIYTQDEQYRRTQVANTEIKEHSNKQENLNHHIQAMMNNYVHFTSSLGSGDLSARIEIQSKDHHDPLIQLGHNLNEMAQQLEIITDRERSSRAQLEQTVSDYMSFVRTIAEGNLIERLDLVAIEKAMHQDDMIQLGHDLNEMAERLSEITQRVRETIITMTHATSEIQSGAKQQVTNVLEQENSITETVATVDELRTIVLKTNEYAKTMLSTSQQSVLVSQKGQDAVFNSIKGMQAIQSYVEDIAGTILILSEHSQQIGEIFDTVNMLSEQSKLLALNASIEAARAKEEGRGFSVVAMEVRQLAEQSRTATKRVGLILDQIQKATDNAVTVTRSGSAVAEQSLQLAEEAGQVIQELARALDIAAGAATQISNSTQQQTSGIDQLVTMIQQIKEAATQTAASTKQSENNVQNLRTITSVLDEITAQYTI